MISANYLLGDLLKKIILLIAMLCCIALSYGAFAINTPANLTKSVSSSTNNAKSEDLPAENITILKQDSGTNFTKMNVTLQASPIVASAQAVEFKPPTQGWKLEHVLVMATDGWNSSSNRNPVPLPFAVEIRDKEGRLLYHYSDTQLPYFTHPQGIKEIKWADIEIPALSVNDNFYVCFYGYSELLLLTEVQNATGNSYYYDRSTGRLYHALIATPNNKTIPVNWIIRAAGE